MSLPSLGFWSFVSRASYPPFRQRLVALATGAIAGSMVVSCGGTGGDAEENAGVISDEWSDYCTATFTEEYQVLDDDHPLFVAQRGDEYLVSEPASETDDSASLYFLTDDGPYEFVVAPKQGATTLPLTFSCEEPTRNHLAAFIDFSVYETDALEKKLCNIDAGTILPLDPEQPWGFTTTSTINGTGPNTFEIYLNTFGEDCGNATSGFVEVPSTMWFGTITWLIPLRTIVSPD